MLCPRALLARRPHQRDHSRPRRTGRGASRAAGVHRDHGAGLEFYPLGGNPHEMMEYIVKTGGSIIPNRLDQLWEDVPKKRAMIAEILASTWRACTEADPEQPGARPFRADLIVANPPSYGHIHCAEALHIPLHMIF